ncbi:MAG: hypothetical protein E3J26_03495 [Candidatus Zixiibacteriota bacterium]|nr:MAG: hypothetical protein E3J26_03495 [candidate division Zixibacteria bacterium]
MTKRTDGAVSAAEKMWDGEKALGILMDRAEYIKIFAAIIDRETGLPEITAERDRLIQKNAKQKESLQFFVTSIETGLLVRDITKDNKPDWALKMMEFIKQLQKAQAALAKEPESGGTKQKGEPK